MAFTGKSTYSAGTELPELAEDVSDIIGIVSPHETPLLDHLGDPKREAVSTVHEWIEDELVPNTDTIDQVVFSPDPESETTITVDNIGRFRVGDLVRPDGSDEVIFVNFISGDAIIVTRGYGGTAAATLTDGLTIYNLGNAAIEGADAIDARFTNRARRQNYTQIFTSTVQVSGSMQATRAYGVSDELDYQKQERMRELLRDLENTVINGIAPVSSPTGSSGSPRTMNGITPSIATNRYQPGVGEIPAGDGSGDELNESVLNAAMRMIWEQSSGVVDTIVVGGMQKRRINGFVSATRSYLPEDTRFQDLVSVYESDFGVARIVLSRWVAADTVLLLDSSRIEVMPLTGRSFHFKPLAATGDSLSGQVIGEYTLEFKNENAHGLINGLAI